MATGTGDNMRLGVIFSVLASILIGIPVWWKTTEIYRASLQTVNSSLLSHQHEWKSSVNIIILHIGVDHISEQQKTQYAEEYKLELTKRLSESAKKKYTSQSLKVRSSWKNLPALAGHSYQEIDDWIKNEPHLQQFPTEINTYNFYIIVSSLNEIKETKLVIGKYRHSFIMISNTKELEQKRVEICNLVENTIFSIFFSPFSLKSNEGIDSVRTATEYRITVSLLIADPLIFNSNSSSTPANKLSISSFLDQFSNSIRAYLVPFVDTINSVPQVARFTIDSQVIQYAALLRNPAFDSKEGIFFIQEEQLPLFFNPADWKLDLTDTTTQPLINFIIYVPGQSSSPLFIKSRSGQYSQTNGFVIPQWGGIVIHNTLQKSRSTNSSSITSDQNSLNYKEKEIKRLMQLLVSQFRGLLGLSSVGTLDGDVFREGDLVILANKELGISDWEKDKVIRRYAERNIQSSIDTLISLSSLVNNLTNMVVEDNIAVLIQQSLEALNSSIAAIHQGDGQSAIKYSQRALDTAEQAFFDPNMIAMLYFPDEHKYAIYALPFLPILGQLGKGLYEEWKARRAKRIR